jgi:hypothetical protein
MLYVAKCHRLLASAGMPDLRFWLFPAVHWRPVSLFDVDKTTSRPRTEDAVKSVERNLIFATAITGTHSTFVHWRHVDQVLKLRPAQCGHDGFEC